MATCPSPNFNFTSLKIRSTNFFRNKYVITVLIAWIIIFIIVLTSELSHGLLDALELESMLESASRPSPANGDFFLLSSFFFFEQIFNTRPYSPLQLYCNCAVHCVCTALPLLTLLWERKNTSCHHLRPFISLKYKHPKKAWKTKEMWRPFHDFGERSNF